MNKNKILENFEKAPTFVDILQKQIELSSNKKAFTFLSNNGDVTYTFSELGVRIKRLASLLQKNNLAGERALLLYPPGMEYIIGYFACLYAGVIAVPVYPPDTSRLKKTLPRLQSIASDSKAKVALSTQSIVDDVEKWKQILAGNDVEMITNAEQLKNHSSQFADLFNLKWIATDNIDEKFENDWVYPDISPKSIAYLQYTSGSTGIPKGVIINHENLLHNTDMIFNGFGLNNYDYEGVIWLPIYHDMGLIGGILEPIFSGFHCTLLSPIDFLKRPLRWLQIISDKKDKNIVSGGPNFAYDLCLRASTPQKREALNLSNWKVAFTGAEPVRAETINEFSKAFKVSGFKKKAFYPCYGLAEGTLIVSGGEQEEEPIQLAIDKEELKKNKAIKVAETHPNKVDFISSGREILDGKIRIVNPDTKTICKEGDIGEVWAASKSNAQGYWEKPEISEETFNAYITDTDEGPFMRTGDLGFIKDRELFITGRLKDLIIIRGSNHYPQDIELTVETSNKLLRPGSVAAFSVDVDGEEQLVVVQEARAKKNINWENVINDIRKAIFDVHNIVPYAIVLIQPKTIFKTSSGKIRRNDTKKAYLNDELEIVYDSRVTNINRVVQESDIEKNNKIKTAATLEMKKYQELLAEKIAKIKNINSDSINIKQPFAEFGIDSAKAVGLVGELEEILNTTLPATLLWDYPTIEKLAEHLAGTNIEKEEKVFNKSQIKKEDIAVIGLGCKFPDAANPNEFWDLLINGKDAIHEVPKERWDIEEFYSPEESKPGKMNTKWGGFINDVDKFDPAFFGISPRETIHMDPQHRLLLETTWQAFENGGILPEEIVGSKTGVFVGIGNQDYSQLNVGDIENLTSYTGTGNAMCIAANRISYTLDFNGPSLAVDTACSSSLVAVHLAAKSLQNGESNMAIAAGVNLILTPDVNVALSQAQMMSPDGRCKTFDESANGYVRSEGCGVVILKRLSEAQKDGDNILAVIKGSAVNQDGKSNGLTAPNRISQEKVINTAIQDANVTINDISYLETHGTGTSLGDPIEVQALTEVFNKKTNKEKIILGAVKSNIGHLETAAGIAGLIKVVLSLKNKFIPQNINFRNINPLIPIDKIPFKIPTENVRWETNSHKRIAGVSSFGFGGTNAHVILEEAPEKIIKENEANRPYNILTVSAKDEQSLNEYIKTHYEYLSKHKNVDLADYSFTANTGRTHFEKRTAFVFSNLNDLLKELSKNKVELKNIRKKEKLNVAFLFTGQGSQYIQMGKELYETQPAFKKEFDRCNEILKEHLEHSLIDVVFPKEELSEKIHNTAYTQPALFAIEYAIAKLWQSFGVQPDYMIGHSVGEYVAAVIADVMSLEDGLKLIAVRGRLMQSLPQDGEMAVIFTDESTVINVIKNYSNKVAIAGVNGPGNIVISGERDAVKEIVKLFEDKDIKTTFLKVSHAFHSPLMQPILADFEKIANEVKYSKTQIPIVSNLTGKLITQNQILDAKYWKEHIRKAVQFEKGMQALAKQNIDVFIEVGPHPVLLGMGQTCLPNSNSLWLPSLRRNNNDWKILLQSLADLYTAGYKIDWKGFDKDYPRNLIFIPTYPFKKERYWLENSSVGVKRKSLSNNNINDFEHPLLHNKIDSPFVEKIIFESRLNANSLSIIKDHKIFGTSLLPATAFVEMIAAATLEAFNNDNYQIEDLTILEGIAFKKNVATRIQIAFEQPENNKSEFQLYSNNDNGNWILNANGFVKLDVEFETKKLDRNNIIERSKKFTEEELISFYASMKEHGFEHGKSMRLIKELWHSEDEAIGLFELDKNHLNEADEYLIHPSLIDSGTQLFAAMISKHLPNLMQEGIYLPIAIEQVKYYKVGYSKVWGYGTKPELLDGNKILKSNLILFNDSGETVLEITGLQYRFTTFEVLSKVLMRDVENWIYKIDWIKKEPEISEISLKGTWLIFENKNGISKELETRINNNGGDVIFVKEGKQFRQIKNNEVEINPEDINDVKTFLTSLKNDKNIKLKGIIYLPGLNYFFEKEPDISTLNLTHKNILNRILVLSQSLALTGFMNSPKILIITNNAQPTDNEEVNLTISHLSGLGRTIDLEFPELNVKRIDFEKNNDKNIISNILDELRTQDNEKEIVYRNGNRFVSRIIKVAQAKQNEKTLPKRLEIHKKGVLDNTKFVPLNRKQPSTGQVEIRVHATGLNFRDVLNALDLYPGDPGLLGGECSGIVTAVGEGVDEFKIGDEVLGVASGSFATHVTTDKNLLVHKPNNISFEEAASIPIVYLTAYYTLKKLANLQKGETVLIHAATGGVGLAAIQIARMLGARIFGTAGSDEKRSVLKSEGIELIMDSRSLDFAQQIMDYTNGKGVDAILNSFSGKHIEKGLSILSKNGRFLEIGKRGIWDKEKVQNFREDIKYFTIAIDDISQNDSALIKEMLLDIVKEFNNGILTPIRNEIFPLEEAVKAFRYMRRAKHIGKIVLTQKVLGKKTKPRTEIIKDATYMITGGRGALGLLTAKWLIKKGAKNLILLGRNKPSDSIKLKIEELSKAGAKILMPNIDVSDFNQLKKFFEEYFADNSQLPPLRGIVHAAGIIDDGILIQQNWERFAKVMKPKISGAWNLHLLTKDFPIDFMIYYSSIASLFGSPGQSNYAAANSFLDVLAHYRRNKGLPAQSINWGPWDYVGMAEKTNVNNNGINKLSPAQGIYLLQKVFDENHIQSGVVSVDWKKFTQQLDEIGIFPLFKNFTSDKNRKEKVVNKTPVLIEKLEKAEQEKRLDIIKSFLSENIQEVLGMDEAQKISTSKPLSEMGIDSLMGLEIKKIIDAAIGENLPATIVFNYPTIDALSGYLLNDVINKNVKKEEEINFDDETVNDDEIIKNIEDLSEEEAEALLLKKLNDENPEDD